MKYAKTTETIDDEKGHLYHITTVPCPMCGGQEVLTVAGSDLFSYNQGAYIQDAFPYLNAAQRERLMTGICGPCFENMFGEDE